MTKQIKTFSSHTEGRLDSEVNSWLKNNTNFNIIDIKFSSNSYVNVNGESWSNYDVIIIYDGKTYDK